MKSLMRLLSPEAHELRTREEEERRRQAVELEQQKKIAREKDKERKEQNKFKKEVETIIKNLDENFTFTSDLNSFQRKIIHDLCEKHKLFHKSVGDGDNRKVTISKNSFDQDESTEIEAINEGIARTQIEPIPEQIVRPENIDTRIVPFQIETRRRQKQASQV